jgi:N-acetylmuramoyl-L-alanine amidase
MVIDMSDAPNFEVFSLTDPDRLVIDLAQATLGPPLTGPGTQKSPVVQVRTGQPKQGVVRIVLDLDGPVEYQVFALKPSPPYEHRLVLDIFAAQRAATRQVAQANRKDDYLVILDPGHGGEDPGAIGGRGTREKHVALGIARRLERMINRDGRMRAQLTRSGDYYVTLRGRVKFAMKQKADAFISVHADAAQRRAARGGSVYILSKKGASSEMGKWLAKRENASDLAGGVDIGGQEPAIQKALLDMGLDWKVKESKVLARRILNEMQKVGRLHSKRVEQAAFVVLKSVDIPAVLVETGFITNRAEEKALANTLHQERLAGAIFRGLSRYCDADPRCPPSRGEKGVYVVRPGDSLSLIAARVGSTVAALRELNGLHSDVLKVGQKIRVPNA